MIKSLVRTLLSNRYIYDIAKDAYNTVNDRAEESINVDIPEATPFEFCRSDLTEKRINLLVPALSEKHVFGGISTALRFFDKVKASYPTARIIVTDETSTVLKDAQFYTDWKVQDIGEPDISGNVIVVAGNRVGQTLPISEGDTFIATAWWTAVNAFKILNWQRDEYALVNERKLIYFIQDFEPGFYPWSTRYALAEATYRKPSRTIPIFNTKLLSDYFSEKKYEFKDSFYFNPILNPTLNDLMVKKVNTRKEKQILIYGRPSIDRNLFPLIIQSLKLWAENYEGAEEWKVLSAGEQHVSIDIGKGLAVESIGKLNLDEYANVLSRSSVGVSLMLSPHPSYPPLEMAMFGVNVVTNTYANKDLTTLVSNTISPRSLDPEDVSKKIIEACLNHKSFPEGHQNNEIFSESETEFPFISQLVEKL